MKTNLLLITIALSIIIYAGSNESDGIVSLTLRDGGSGCACHNLEPNDSVHVWIEGLDSVFVNDTVDYKLFMTGGPAVTGGFDLAVLYGMPQPADPSTHIEFGELTHNFPFPFMNDTVSWNFKYIAPDSSVTDTIYSVANSVNGDGIPIPLLDLWNFSENFPVVVIEHPVTVEDEFSPVQFSLSQNYPNPFNPGTSIQYSLSKRQFVSLKVYDVLGNEVATLVNVEKQAGTYEVEFSAKGGSTSGGNAYTLPSGVYIYKLETNNYVDVKKMILLK